MATPAFEKQNAATERARMFKEMNASAGRPAGRGVRNQPVTVGSGTSVRSAAMNDPKPLSPQEVAERDARARELGLLPAEEGDGPYSSLAAAQAAAGELPVELPAATQVDPRAFARAMAQQEALGLPNLGVTAAPASLPIVRLPDFRKVSGFDFHRNVLYIDGLEFEIPEEDVRSMKAYAVDLALNHVVKQLAAAMVEFGVPEQLAEQMGQAIREGAKNGAGEPTTEATEAVQEVRQSGHQSGESSEV